MKENGKRQENKYNWKGKKSWYKFNCSWYAVNLEYVRFKFCTLQSRPRFQTHSLAVDSISRICFFASYFWCVYVLFLLLLLALFKYSSVMYSTLTGKMKAVAKH